MRIYLLRHARAQPIDGDFYGAGLPPESVDAVRALARSGVIPRPDLLISSPFRRALETVAPFAELWSLPVEVDDAFAEWKLRTLNLEDPGYSKEEERGFDNPTLPVAGGESLDEMRERVLTGLERVIGRRQETALVVCHGTVIHLACAHVAGREPTVEALRSTPFLVYAVLEADGSGLRVLRDIERPAAEEA